MAGGDEQLVGELLAALGTSGPRCLVLDADAGTCASSECLRRRLPPGASWSDGTGPVAEGPFDCVLVPDLVTLAGRRPRWAESAGPALRGAPVVVAAFGNARRHGALREWLGYGTFPAGKGQALATLSEGYRLLLDAGLAPEPGLPRRVITAAPPGFAEAFGPLLTHLGLDPARVAFHLGASHWVIRAAHLTPVGDDPGGAVTVSVCVTDPSVLQSTLASSPDLTAGAPHELLPWGGCPNAAAGHNRALEDSRHEWVLCAHQDVYLPRGWLGRFRGAVRRAEAALGRLDVVGVYGVLTGSRGAAVTAGHVIDRENCLRPDALLPGLADSLDELLIAVRPDSGLRFDPALGWHLYGTDLCLAAQAAGRRAAVVDALCHHDSRSCGLPEEFGKSAEYLASKWPARMPVGTSCGQILPGGPVQTNP